MYYLSFTQQNKRVIHERTVRTPEMYARFMQQAEEERFWPPERKRMTSRQNPLGLSHTTFLKICEELRMHPYSKKKVQ